MSSLTVPIIFNTEGNSYDCDVGSVGFCFSVQSQQCEMALIAKHPPA